MVEFSQDFYLNWEQSATKVITLASERLQLQLSTDAIERAHRLGRYTSDKNRPIIVKFATQMTKELVFSKRSLLSGSQFALKQDFSLATRIARKKLREFSRTLNVSTRLNHNKLMAGGKCYVYDPGEDSVVERVSKQLSKPTNDLSESSSSRNSQNAPLSPRLTRSGRTHTTKK